MWPFNYWNKKNKQIYKPGAFAYFGSSSANFTQIYTSSQDNELLINYFNNVAEVAAPPLKYADGAGQVTFETENKEVAALLNKPNYYQGFNEFFSLLILYDALLGNSIIDAFTTIKLGQGEKPENLFVLSPQYTAIETTKDKDFRFNNILNYIFDSHEVDKDALIIDPKNILHLKEVNPNFVNNQYLFGESRYAGCYRNIESIIEGYGAKVNLYKNGPRLIITGKSQGEFAGMSNDENIEDVQERMKKYGAGADKYNNLITDVPLDVTNASLNVAQMQILPNNQHDFDRLCDAQGMSSKIFSKDTKFEDSKAALSDFYNNAFRSKIDSRFNDLQTFLQTWWPDLDDLRPNYSQISEIVDANETKNSILLADAEKGLITRNEYLEAIGKEPRDNEDFNKLFVFNNGTWTSIEPVLDAVDNLEQSGVSQEQLEAQANLRGSVGGVQGILAIQESVQAGTTDYSAAIVTLIEIYGFDDATARAILGTPGDIKGTNNGKVTETIQINN